MSANKFFNSSTLGNAGDLPRHTEQDIRTQLAQLLARYDGAVPPGVYSTIRSLPVELAWMEHRGRQSK
jgi:hypothetical protein